MSCVCRAISFVYRTVFKPVSPSLSSLVEEAERLFNETSLTAEKQKKLVQVTEEAFKAAKLQSRENTSDTELCTKAILLRGRALLTVNKINLSNIKSFDKNVNVVNALFNQYLATEYTISKPDITATQAIEIEYFTQLYLASRIKPYDSDLRKIQKNPATPCWIQEELIKAIGDIQEEKLVSRPEILKCDRKDQKYSSIRTTPANREEAFKICLEIMNECNRCWGYMGSVAWFWGHIELELELTNKSIPLSSDISRTRTWLQRNIKADASNYAHTCDPIDWKPGLLDIFDELVEKAGWENSKDR